MRSPYWMVTSLPVVEAYWGSGERLDRWRQPLLDLALDVNGGVQLIHQVDAELLLHVPVGDDLLRRCRHLVGLEQLGLNPVRSDREDQQHRRDHDQWPDDGAMTPARLVALCFSVGVAVHLASTVCVSIGRASPAPGDLAAEPWM